MIVEILGSYLTYDECQNDVLKAAMGKNTKLNNKNYKTKTR